MPKHIAAIALACIAMLPAAACSAPPARSNPATPVRVVCTAPTLGKPQACWVEFGATNVGPKVETATQAEAEELVAILLANPGATYYLDDGLSVAGQGVPAARKQRERSDLLGVR